MSASGIKVIITSSSISDLALQHLNNHSIAILKVPSKFELRRLCRVVNAIPLDHMEVPTSEEEVGWVDVYETVDFDGGDRRVTVLRQLISGDPGFEKSGRRGDGKGEEKTTQTATIVLRGGTTTANNNLDDLESAIDDGINLVGFVLWQRRFVPGAGKTELELARRVNLRAGKMKGQQRYVVKRFATALEVIPRTLAENAAAWEREGNKSSCQGEDEPTEPSDEAKSPSDGMILPNSNSLPYPILDSLAIKRSAIHLATETAVSVLTAGSNGSKGGWFGMPQRLVINVIMSPFSAFSFSTPEIFIIAGTMTTVLLVTILVKMDYKIQDDISIISSYFSSWFR